MSALLEIRGLRKEFAAGGWPPWRRRAVRAVDGVDLDVGRGECVALVGESGSGKTTLGRCALRLLEPTAGTVRFDGDDLLALPPAALRRRRRDFQMVFQDPYGSLDPRRTVGATLEEPLRVHRLAADRRQRRRRVEELLQRVGLPADAAGRRPHEFSGGQRQRVGIARALATGPRLLVADEPVSALDVSVRAQIVNLLSRLQRELELAVLFIAHDLALVEHVADRVAVMYLGRVVEEGSRERVLGRPAHPYTVSLLSAVPVPEPGGGRRRVILEGDPPSPLSPPAGCPFHPRCPIARERCADQVPPLETVGSGARAACFFAGELEQKGSTPVALDGP